MPTLPGGGGSFRPPNPTLAAGRADEAAIAVVRHFGHRLLGLPFTLLGAVRRPSPGWTGPWHYWWQAHFLDCLVDAGRRELRREQHYDGGNGPSAGRLAARLLRTVRWRNGFRFPNAYYDDMAWLALATQRLDKLAADANKPRFRPRSAARRLLPQLESAHTPDLGGGLFWSTARDFKNTPATAPAALYLARAGDTGQAARLLDWLDAELYDPERRLYLDGVRLASGKPVLVPDVYTYNQGPVLAALLEVGRDTDLQRAAELVHGIAAALVQQPEVTEEAGRKLILRTHGAGDGGLFTGILARYLAVAARSDKLPGEVRELAARMVADTAEGFWAGRAIENHRSWEVLVFSADPAVPAAGKPEPGTGVELSTQLQAWMTLEAAATLAG
ncbi:glycoside hydrolase family 76 protein [Arthrobacter sp. NPDC089319]|uniref:glycoside hydrolase family 76 protein n=1 Tax=Arthrobacter sp. NPDC089319 TaxID=3155915 RepID=UPI003419A24F